MLTHRLFPLLALLAAASTWHCGDRCGDLRRDGDRCIAREASVASTSDADAGASDGASAADSGAADHSAIRGLGALCSVPAHCSEEADYCAMQPGASSGYCSISGCQPGDPASCPAGYYCFDLSVFAAGLPTFCAQE